MIPTLTTDRLTLRAPTLRDFDAYAAFRACKTSMEWLGGPIPREAAWHQFCALHGQWDLRGYGRWIVTERDSDRPLALVGLFEPIGWPEPEMSWAVFPGCEGRGIATEATLAARRWWYALGHETVISHVAPGNDRSVAMALRLGCREDATMSHPLYGELVRWRHPGPLMARTPVAASAAVPERRAADQRVPEEA